MTRHVPRGGFKLIDLMVAILVIGLLFALLPPILQHNVTECRRPPCQHNLRMIGLGLLGYADAKHCFPNAGTIFDDPDVHRGDPTASNLYLAVVDPAKLAGKPDACLRSWVVDILPFLDNQELYNSWNFQLAYDSTAPAGVISNSIISDVAVGVLRCPQDPTASAMEGNSSFAVNGGFARWPAMPVSWTGSAVDGQSRNGEVLLWTPLGRPWRENQEVGRKLGVMFLGTQTGDQPWDFRTDPATISDGASSTLLAGENMLVGKSEGTAYSGGLATNWACPLPNFTMFLGSDDVCRTHRSPTDCLGGQLAPRDTGRRDGPGWAKANAPGSSENINGSRSLTVEGSFPFANSRHPGGSNFLSCDGAVRYINDTIDGTVYARLLTPAGDRLPEAIRQSPLPPNPY